MNDPIVTQQPTRTREEARAALKEITDGIKKEYETKYGTTLRRLSNLRVALRALGKTPREIQDIEIERDPLESES